MMRRNEAGYSYLELVVSSAIIALAFLLMMPSLNGYQVNGEVRAFSTQITSQLRNAEELASSQGQILNWRVCWDCAQNIIQFVEPNGEVISQTILPPQLHVSGACYNGRIFPQGEVVVNLGACGNPATFVIVCIDDHTASYPDGYGWQLTVVSATGQAIGQPIEGHC